jgi:hypothetical protein
MPEREVWERQPGESSRAYAAFCIYRDMGPKRGLREAAKRYYESKTRTNVAQIGKWSSKWNWVARCRAWDDHHDALARERQTVEIQEMRDRQARLGVAMQAAAGRGLQTFNPSDATGHEITRLAAEGTRIERLARGEPTEIEKEVITFQDLVAKAKQNGENQ